MGRNIDSVTVRDVQVRQGTLLGHMRLHINPATLFRLSQAAIQPWPEPVDTLISSPAQECSG